MESLYDHVAGYLIKFVGFRDIINLSMLSKTTNKIFAKYIEFDYSRIVNSLKENPIINEYYFISDKLSLNEIIWFSGKNANIKKYHKIVRTLPVGYKRKKINEDNDITKITISSPKFKILYLNEAYYNNIFILKAPNIEFIYLHSSVNNSDINNNKIILGIPLNKLKIVVCDHDFNTSRGCIYNSVQYLSIEGIRLLDELLSIFPGLIKVSICISYIDLLNYNGINKFNNLTHLQIQIQLGQDKLNNLSEINKVLKNIRLLCPNLVELHYYILKNGDLRDIKLNDIFDADSHWHYKVIKYITSFGIKYETSHKKWTTEHLPEKYRPK